MDRDAPSTARAFFCTCDRLVVGGLMFLVLFTPLAFGTVHAWAFSLMEAVLFFLAMLWASKLLAAPPPVVAAVKRWRVVVTPLLLCIGFAFVQLTPLPPALLAALSPATYEAYSRALPGWPERVPYQEDDAPPSRKDSEQGEEQEESRPYAVLPTPEEVKKGAPVPQFMEIAANEELEESEDFSEGLYFGRQQAPSVAEETGSVRDPRKAPFYSRTAWRPLALAPELTWTNILKCLAYLALLGIVVSYPFGFTPGDQTEERFLRSILVTLLGVGMVVACLGLAQRFTWNGKILWFFVPYDWGAPRPEITPHATGPFISHVHFANYLGMLLPLAVMGVLFRSFLSPQRADTARGFRVLCGVATLLFLTALLLSLSRGAWIGLGVSSGVILWAFARMPRGRRSLLLRQPGKRLMYVAALGLVFLLLLAVALVGPAGREQIDARLETTVFKETSLWVRVAAWRDSLPMIRDFPFFGVGLGSWPDLFPRYRQPPWPRDFFREAHNDYLQLLVEGGVLGMICLGWFFWRSGSMLMHGVRAISHKALPTYVALLAACGMMAFHEFFDFNLQIPANAFLFTLLFGLALRLAGQALLKSPEESAAFQSVPWEGEREIWKRRLPVTACVWVAAAALLYAALRQDGRPYPHYLREAKTAVEARAQFFTHPTHPTTHATFLRFQKDAPLTDRIQALERALWFDPHNPFLQDRYALALFHVGKTEEGLAAIRSSVFASPAPSTHRYLSRRLLPWLSSEEHVAVEEGLRRALSERGYAEEGAVRGLANLYGALGRYAEEGAVYAEAARQAQEASVRLHYLLNAGIAYARADNREQAETALRAAANIAPQDPRPYQHLALYVFAPRADLVAAKQAVAAGVRRGADPLPLYLSLGEAARKIGELEEAKTALQHAIAVKPAASEAHFRLGLLYIQEKNFDRAALSLRKAADLSAHAEAFFYLGVAEENRYQFFAAEKAYARAVELAPENESFQQRYQQLLQKLVENVG